MKVSPVLQHEVIKFGSHETIRGIVNVVAALSRRCVRGGRIRETHDVPLVLQLQFTFWPIGSCIHNIIVMPSPSLSPPLLQGSFCSIRVCTFVTERIYPLETMQLCNSLVRVLCDSLHSGHHEVTNKFSRTKLTVCTSYRLGQPTTSMRRLLHLYFKILCFIIWIFIIIFKRGILLFVIISYSNLFCR